jgi:uncharacterized membrane protein
MNIKHLLPALLLLSTGIASVYATEKQQLTDHYRAQWNTIHFSPAIDSATNEQCLSCHMEILQRKILVSTPAGVPAETTLAWYQTLNTYKGSQETFHRRHLVTDYAKQVMQMKCITCHQGENPREEAPVPPDITNTNFTLRKQINPETCLMCHGNFPDYKRMGLPSHWNESREMFQNNCLLCHSGIRTNRHQVNFLKPEAIEAMAKDDSDVCFGCHGGRQWYRISYPYPRHAWGSMQKEIPDWAKNRPTESNPRFRNPQQAQK